MGRLHLIGKPAAEVLAVLWQVVALPPVEAVVSGAIKTSDIPACNEKVDIWALGVTLYELLTGANAPPELDSAWPCVFTLPITPQHPCAFVHAHHSRLLPVCQGQRPSVPWCCCYNLRSLSLQGPWHGSDQGCHEHCAVNSFEHHKAAWY